jgi:23S rRNA (guanine745-N1)-methyltransferase
LLGGAQPKNADNTAMVAARQRVHEAGVFTPLAQALRELTADLGLSVDNPALEVGAGTGYYLYHVVDPLGAAGIAIDVSTAAARVAAQASPLIASVVADVWERIPLLDQVAGVILCVFAPRNLDEFARVLAPGGRLIVVTPNAGHLAALRARHGLLAIGEGKQQALTSGPFQLIGSHRIHYPVRLSAGLAADVIAMGPNAFHSAPRAVEPIDDHVDVTRYILRSRSAGVVRDDPEDRAEMVRIMHDMGAM